MIIPSFYFYPPANNSLFSSETLLNDAVAVANYSSLS